MTHSHDTDDDATESIALRDVLRVLRTHWVAAVLAALVCVAGTAVWTIAQPRVWSSEASALVQAFSGGDLAQAYAAESLAQSRAETYLRLAESQAVAEAAAEILEAPSGTALLGSVAVTRAEDSAILSITARSSSPEAARDLADAWVVALVEQVELLENPAGSLTNPAVAVVPLAAATLPGLPSSPNVTAALVVGLIVGGVAALISAFVLNHLDRRIRSAAQVEERLGLPVVGTIVEYESFHDHRDLVSRLAAGRGDDRRAHFAVLEALRELRTNLSYLDVDDPPRSLVIVSATPGEGKSTLAANLADTIAATGERVVVIDCDLRKPTQSETFRLEGAVGITDVLSGRAALADVAQPVGHRENLLLVAAGATPPNPSELLGSRAMRDVLAELRADGTFVIIDAPPLLAVTDGAVLASVADGVLVAVNTRRTTRDQLARATASLRKVGGNLLGVVLNRVPVRGAEAQSYGYYGSSYYYPAADGGTPGDEGSPGDEDTTSSEASPAPSRSTESRRAASRRERRGSSAADPETTADAATALGLTAETRSRRRRRSSENEPAVAGRSTYVPR